MPAKILPKRPLRASLLAGVLVALLPAVSSAQFLEAEMDQTVDGLGRMTVEEYWTRDRIRSARPAPMGVTTFREPGVHRLRDDRRQSRSVESFDPSEEPEINPRVRRELEQRGSRDDAGDDPVSRMVSSTSYPFTSRRVTPRSAVTSGPYRRVGKLFFDIPGAGPHVCSASVISRRLIITAAHCVYDRDTNSFYRNVVFIPAFDGTLRNSDPYCTWTGEWAIVTWAWANSSGYPAPDDFALLEMRDRWCNGGRHRIGDYLGWFGWSTFSLHGNHIAQLGYPGNLDNGQRMQITHSATYRRNHFAAEIGSAHWQGTSGGPWVQNLGLRPAGQQAIGPAGRRGWNQIVGVSSYVAGPRLSDHNAHQIGGATILNNRFVHIWNRACSRHRFNCP